MSNILTIAFTTEGTTDERFLKNIITKVFEELCFECESDIEVYEPLYLKFPKKDSFVEDVKNLSLKAFESGINVLCIHTDADHRNDKEVNVIADLLKKELNLSETQTHQLEKIRTDFFEKEQVLAQDIKEKRDSMNMIMFNQDTNDTFIQLLAKLVADGEYQMELLRFQQAQSLKEICTMEQKKKIQYLVIEIRDYFRPEKRK